MTDINDRDDQNLIPDFVKDAVIALPETIAPNDAFICGHDASCRQRLSRNRRSARFFALRRLRDRPRPGRQPRVDAVTSARFKERIVAGAELERDGVVAFRAVDAQRILKEEFEIDCSLSSTYRLLHRIKLSWLAPRPRHPQADATAQAAFSQLLDCN